MALGRYFIHLFIHSLIHPIDLCRHLYWLAQGCREEQPGGQHVELLDGGGRAWKVMGRACLDGTVPHLLQAYPGDACPSVS